MVPLSAYGLAHLQAGRAAVIGSTMPLWAMIMAKFVLKEQLTFERLVGLGLGLVGLTILIWPDIRAIGEAPFHAAFMLGAAISWAAGTITMKHFQWTTPIIVLTGWQFILGGIPIVAGTSAFSPSNHTLSDFIQSDPLLSLHHYPSHHLLPLGLVQGSQPSPHECRFDWHTSHPGSRCFQRCAHPW